MKRDMNEIKESIYFLNHLFYFVLLAFQPSLSKFTGDNLKISLLYELGLIIC